MSYLLLAPFYIEVNTETGLCQVRFHRMAKAGIRIVGNRLQIYLNVAGYTKLINTIDVSGQHLSEKKKKIVVKRKRRSSSIQLIKAIARSFRVNRCYVNIDTGDLGLNGMLFPLFFWMSTASGKHIYINFLGENTVVLEIQNRLSRILQAFFINYFSSKTTESWKT